jgi:cysteine desulfuration protein SufE
MYPPRLAKIVAFFEPLAEIERRENLLAYAERVARCAPKSGETYDVQDVRKDAECSDAVGIFLRLDEEERVHLRVTLGPQVQTLTRALAAILCHGLEGATAAEIVALPANFVPKIVGAQLIRQRSQTVYYLLDRVKSAVRVLRATGTSACKTPSLRRPRPHPR